MDMPVNALTCADVEARDLQARYVAGTLPAAEAVEYEAHYFECDACWPSLQRATELRAAFAMPTLPPARRARPWRLAAAAVLVIAVGTGVLLRAPAPAPGSRPALRGASDALTLRASTDARATNVSWDSVPEADSYLVRLYRADGDLVFERETAVTAFVLSADSVPRRAVTDTLYWQVLALDRLRQTLARSPLTAAPPPASR